MFDFLDARNPAAWTAEERRKMSASAIKPDLLTPFPPPKKKIPYAAEIIPRSGTGPGPEKIFF